MLTDGVSYKACLVRMKGSVGSAKSHELHQQHRLDGTNAGLHNAAVHRASLETLHDGEILRPHYRREPSGAAGPSGVARGLRFTRRRL